MLRVCPAEAATGSADALPASAVAGVLELNPLGEQPVPNPVGFGEVAALARLRALLDHLEYLVIHQVGSPAQDSENPVQLAEKIDGGAGIAARDLILFGLLVGPADEVVNDGEGRGSV